MTISVREYQKRLIDKYKKLGIPHEVKLHEKTIVDYFERSAKLWPTRKIVMATGKIDASINYKEAIHQMYAVSAGLLIKLANKGNGQKRIAIHLPSIPQHIIATMAVRHAGMVDIPVDPKWESPSYILEKMKQVDVSCIITTDYMAEAYLAIRDQLPNKPIIIATHLSDYYSSIIKPLISLKLKRAGKWANIKRLEKKHESVIFSWKDFLYKHWTEKHSGSIKPNDDSTLIFGSGTGGQQKVIRWKHKALTYHTALTLNYNTYPLGDPLSLDYGQETLLSVIPFSHAFGSAVCINVGLALGANLILVPKPVKPIKKDGREIMVFDPKVVIDVIEKYQPTIVPLAPKIYMKILEHVEKMNYVPDFKFVKKFISGSAKLPKDIAERWREVFGVPIYEGYGLTETCTAGNVNHHLHNHIGTVGTPPPGVDQIVVDNNMNPVFDKKGEVLIKGDFLFSEYYQNSKDTKKSFLKDGKGRYWFKTGDIGIISSKNLTLTIEGRKKYIIIPKNSGKNVSPETIEVIISAHPSVEDVAVLGVPTEKYDEEVAAVVVLKESSNIKHNEARQNITELCNEKLEDPIEIPTLIKFTDQAKLEKIGALTGTGKIKKEILKKHLFDNN